MTAIYDNFGIRFMYPENWRVSDEPGEEQPHVVTVECPGGGFWALHVYESPVDPLQLVAEVLRILRSEYEDLDAQSVTERLGPVEVAGYDMDFYCLDMVVSAQARGFSLGGRTFLLVVQAEEREFEQMEGVFQAITVSLLKELGASGSG